MSDNSKIKSFFSKLKNGFGEDIKLRIYALLLAIVAWFIVSVSLYPNAENSVSDVQLLVDISGTSAERSGLSVISQNVKFVNVTVSGNRSVLGNIKNSDVKAKAVISNITEPGTYELPITAAVEDADNVTAVSNTETVEVVFDRVISRTFDLNLEIPNLQVDDGYIYLKEEAHASPNNVTITGPEAKINNITECAVKNVENMNLHESQEIVNGNELVLYNNNTILSTDGLNIDKTSFSINIPIYKTQTIKLNPTFTNIPYKGFPTADIKYEQDVKEILVAAPPDMLDNLTELNLGYIDLNTIDIGTVTSLPITLPEQFKNLSETDTVNITFPTEGMAKKTFEIKRDHILVINAPSEYDIKPVTSGYSVTFVGPEDVIESMTIQDIVVQMDLSSISITGNDYFNAPLTIFSLNKGCVWLLNHYTATFQSSMKE